MNKSSFLLLALIIGVSLTSCTNGGSAANSSSSWQTVGNSFPVPNIAFNSVVVSSNGKIYAGGSADVNNGLVLGNTAVSGNWQLVGGNYTPTEILYESYSEQVGALAVSKANVVYAAINTSYSNSILMYSDPSNNAGAWQPLGDPYSMPENGIINALAIDTTTNTVYAATALGYPTSSKNQPDYHGNVYSDSINALMPQQIGLGSAPDGGVMNSVLVESGTVFAASGGYTINSDGSAAYFGDVYSADSAGVHAWQQIGGGGTPDHGVANSIALSSDKNSIYVATSNGNVYKSSVSPSGVWSTALGGGVVPDGSAINSIAIANSGIIYAATALGHVYSVTGNNRWQQVGGGAMPDGRSINAIAVYGMQVYAATEGGHVYVVTFP